MSILSLIVILLVFMLVWYLITLMPIDAKGKKVAQIILIVIVILWLLSLVGVLPGIRLS